MENRDKFVAYMKAFGVELFCLVPYFVLIGYYAKMRSIFVVRHEGGFAFAQIVDLIRNFFGLDNMDKFKYLNIIFATPYTEDRLNRLVQEYVLTEKWEGLIFRRADVSYKPGRTNDLLKYKLFKDAEYRVVDVEITTKPMLNDNGIMEDKECVGALVIELENGNTCKVGTGLSDEQRIEWLHKPYEIIGKQILVKYKEKTKNADGTWSLQFPVLMHVFEEDRDF
jgi:ATP-dependent DNA ligase